MKNERPDNDCTNDANEDLETRTNAIESFCHFVRIEYKSSFHWCLQILLMHLRHIRERVFLFGFPEASSAPRLEYRKYDDREQNY